MLSGKHGTETAVEIRLDRVILVLLMLGGLFCSQHMARAQQERIDSLRCQLHGAVDDTLRANLLSDLSSAFTNVNIDSAKCSAQEALELAESIGYMDGIARALNAYGLALWSSGSIPQALEHYQKSLSISQSTGNKREQAKILNLIGLLYQNQGRLKKALECYEQSLDIREVIGDHRGAASCLLNIGNIYLFKGAYENARDKYQQNLRIRQELNDRVGMAAGYGSLAVLLHLQGKNEEAMEEFTKSVQLSDEIGDKTNAALGRMNIGLILGTQGKYALALEQHQKSLKLFEELGLKQSIATSLLNIGVVHQSKSQYSQALDHFRRSLNIFSDLGDKSGVASCLKNIGVIYERQGANNEAIEHYRKSLNIYTALGYKREVACCLSMIGILHRLCASYEKALDALQGSLKLYDELKDKSGIASVSNAIGNVYSTQGDYKNALPYLQRSVALREELGEMSQVAASLCDIGWYQHTLGDDSNARLQLERGLQIAEELQATETIGCILARLHKFHASLGDYQAAYEYSRRQIVHRNSTRNSEERKELQELMQKYEAEKREREIGMLEKDKALQSLELARRDELVRRSHLEALQRNQKIELLSREAELQQLEVAMTLEQLKNKNAETERHQQKIKLLEKDRKLKVARLAQATTLRDALITGAALFVIIGLLILRRMHDKRRTAELQALVAQAHANAADMQKFRIEAEAERREKQAQQRFARGLLDAQETERKRLAGELHDSLGQDLIVVKNRLLLLRETAKLDGDLDEAITGVGETLEDVRRLSRDLRPYQLDRYGIGKALHALVARADESSSVRLTADIADIDGLWDKDAEVCIYRIVQEGLSNILKHADAQNARIRMQPQNGDVFLSIEDDGKGFPAENADDAGALESGFGLKGMAERAEILGGSMSLSSLPGEGTKIEILLPVPIQDPTPSMNPGLQVHNT